MTYEDKLYEIARSFDEDHLEIGMITEHPDGRTVKIIDGVYRDKTYGRISNFWYWREVLPDGSLSEKKEGGYGWNPKQCYCEDGVEFDNETCKRCGKHGVLDAEWWLNKKRCNCL